LTPLQHAGFIPAVPSLNVIRQIPPVVSFLLSTTPHVTSIVLEYFPPNVRLVHLSNISIGSCFNALVYGSILIILYPPYIDHHTLSAASTVPPSKNTMPPDAIVSSNLRNSLLFENSPDFLL